MKRIWKYNLPIKDVRGDFSIPKNSKIIHVACQKPHIVSFWAEVDDDNETELRHLVVFGTGETISRNNKYIGTALDGLYVWHLYENK